MAIVSREKIEEAASLAPKPEPKRQQNNGQYKGTSHRLKLDEYLRDCGVDFRQEPAKGGGEKYIIDPCPFNPDHKGKDAAIFQDPDGKLTFYCFHNRCQGKTWHDVRSLLGDPKPEHWDPPKDFKRQHREYKQQQPDEAPEIFEPISIWDLARAYLTSSIAELTVVGKNSSINRINSKLKAVDEWTASSIEERQAMLIQLAKEVWKTSLIDAT